MAHFSTDAKPKNQYLGFYFHIQRTLKSSLFCESRCPLRYAGVLLISMRLDIHLKMIESAPTRVLGDSDSAQQWTLKSCI